MMIVSAMLSYGNLCNTDKNTFVLFTCYILVHGEPLFDIEISNLIFGALQNLLHISLMFSKRSPGNPFNWYKVSNIQQAVLLWSSRAKDSLNYNDDCCT